MADIILFFIFLVLFLLIMHWIPFFRESPVRFLWIIGFFLIKVIAGEIAWYLYTYIPYFQDSSDAFRYFTDGKFLYDSFFENKKAFFSLLSGIHADDPVFSSYHHQMISWNRVYETAWFNENRTLIRFHALADFISSGNYHINLLISNFLAFTGLLGIYKFFSGCSLKKNIPWLIIPLFFLPGVIFWGSIPSKESFALLAIGILLTGIKRFSEQYRSFSPYLLMILGIALLFMVKLYLFFILIPLLPAYLINDKFYISKPYNQYLTCISWFFTLVMILNWIFPVFDPVHWLLQQQKNFFGLAAFRDQTTPLSGIIQTSTLAGLILKSPLALLSAIVGMYFPPVYNVWAWLAIVENTLLLLLIIWGITRLHQKIFNNNFLSFFLILMIMDLTIIGFTTPYAGAIHRYRIITIPLLLCALLGNIRQKPFPLLEKFIKPNNTDPDE